MMGNGYEGSGGLLPLILLCVGALALGIVAAPRLVEQRSRSGLGLLFAAIIVVVGAGTWLAADVNGPWARWDRMPMHGAGIGPGWVWLAGDGDRVDNLEEARDRAERFAETIGTDVAVVEVMRFSNHYYAELAEHDGTLMTEVLVDPRDGAVQIEFGPAMMWNSRFSMMARVDTENDVTATEAGGIAGRWAARRDLTVGDAEAFPGYFTLHTLRDGEIVGMVSVNASSGAVWPHTWHGDFEESSD